MNWNHCEDLNEYNNTNHEKQTQASMYATANPDYKILVGAKYMTTKEIYDLSIETKSEEFLNMIIKAHSIKNDCK